MIKLVVSDMDGTLLDSKKNLPQDMGRAITELREQGVLFAPASGRQAIALKNAFEPLGLDIPDMPYIAEDGAVAYSGDELIYAATMDDATVQAIYDASVAIDGFRIVLCAPECCYIDDENPTFVRHVHEYFNQVEVVDNLGDLLGTVPFCKISCVDDVDVWSNSYPKLRHLEEICELKPAGDAWLNFIRQDECKGKAVSMLMKHLGIAPDEVMSFGDYLNDLSLMDPKVCTHSWAMKNAHPDLQSAAANVTAWTNDENGVMRTVWQAVKKYNHGEGE